MPIYKLKLRNKYEVAYHTLLLEFERPNGFNFIPGQYGGFTLIDPPEKDANGVTRRFSLLSTPNDDYIAIATRVQQSAYKRVLSNLKPGDEIKFAGPTGNFTLKEDETVPHVMLAGGIGIAPFYSMLKFATQTQSPHQFFLFFGNNNPTETPFITEINALQQQNRNIQVFYTFVKPNPGWQGETGFITEAMLRKYIKSIEVPYYYICGSPAMVTALQEMLAEIEIDETRIFTEDFPGY